MNFARFPAKDRPRPNPRCRVFAAVLVPKELHRGCRCKHTDTGRCVPVLCVLGQDCSPLNFLSLFFYFLRCKSQPKGDKSVWFKSNIFKNCSHNEADLV